MSVNCVVIEDEQPARELLANFIAKVHDLELVGTYKGPLEVHDVSWTNVDLLFTDIEMSDMNGLSFLRTLTVKPFIIITTAYSEYAIEGYELDIVDYLVKPFPFDRFLTAVNKVKSRLGTKPIQAIPLEPTLLIQADHKTYRIQPNDILFIEGMREYARYHLSSGEKLMELVALKSLEATLPPQFIRIHKSFIINKHFVRAFEGVSVEISDHKIPIGKNYRSSAKKFLSEI